MQHLYTSLQFSYYCRLQRVFHFKATCLASVLSHSHCSDPDKR